MAEVPKKPQRPRDELGRPQPWDSENRLHMENYDELTPEENHRLGIEHWNARRWFPAHEAWETVWKQRRDQPLTELFKGLSQLGAGYTHLHRGNAHGAKTLLRRGAGRVGKYPPGTVGVDTRALSRAALEHADRIDAETKDDPSQARGVIDPAPFVPPRI